MRPRCQWPTPRLQIASRSNRCGDAHEKLVCSAGGESDQTHHAPRNCASERARGRASPASREDSQGGSQVRWRVAGQRQQLYRSAPLLVSLVSSLHIHPPPLPPSIPFHPRYFPPPFPASPLLPPPNFPCPHFRPRPGSEPHRRLRRRAGRLLIPAEGGEGKGKGHRQHTYK